jgi:hypothetical protein
MRELDKKERNKKEQSNWVGMQVQGLSNWEKDRMGLSNWEENN